MKKLGKITADVKITVEGEEGTIYLLLTETNVATVRDKINAGLSGDIKDGVTATDWNKRATRERKAKTPAPTAKKSSK